MIKKIIYCLIPIALIACSFNGVFAQEYPSRPIHIIVPYTAGGSSDFVARTIAAKMQENMGQAVVVDNRPGGNTVIGSELVAKAAPDGYTLLLAGFGSMAATPALHKNLPYDTIKDFVPISNAVISPIVAVVNPSVPANSMKELVAYAKANPGKLNYGSAGVGNTLHLAAETFCLAAGVKMTHVPYKGASQALGDLLGGSIQVMFDLPQTPLTNIQAGRLKALAVTGQKRISVMLNVPTMAEAGFPEFNFVTWIGLVAPAGTPAAISNRLHKEIAKVLNQQSVQDAFDKQVMIVTPSKSPEEYQQFIKSEYDRLCKLIKTANIKVE